LDLLSGGVMRDSSMVVGMITGNYRRRMIQAVSAAKAFSTRSNVFGTAGGRPVLPPVLPYNRVTKAVSVSMSHRLHSSLIFETMNP
jgi:hypothetical protein